MVVFLLLRQRERERERESSFFFGRKFRISFYFLICFINPNGVSPGNGGVMEELMDGVSLQKTLFLFVLLDVSVVCPRVVFRVLVAQWLRFFLNGGVRTRAALCFPWAFGRTPDVFFFFFFFLVHVFFF